MQPRRPWGIECAGFPAETLACRIRAARATGAAFVQLALYKADLYSLDEGSAAAAVEAAREGGLPVASVRIEGLTRFSEISTHPRSRVDVLRRLAAAAELAGRLGAGWLVMAAKEVVPAEVAVPAYRSGLEAVAAVLESAHVRIALNPAEGWPPAEAIHLAREILRPPIALCLDAPAPDSATDLAGAARGEMAGPVEEAALIRIIGIDADPAGAGDPGMDPSFSARSGLLAYVMRSTPGAA